MLIKTYTQAMKNYSRWSFILGIYAGLLVIPVAISLGFSSNAFNFTLILAAVGGLTLPVTSIIGMLLGALGWRRPGEKHWQAIAGVILNSTYWWLPVIFVMIPMIRSFFVR